MILQKEKLFQQLSKELLNENAPDLHNQAIMEFGALFASQNYQNVIFVILIIYESTHIIIIWLKTSNQTKK